MIKLAKRAESSRHAAHSNHALLLPRERHAELSSPGFRGWKSDLDGTLYYDDKPVIRKLISYTVKTLNSLTPEMTIHRALIKHFTKYEMGTALPMMRYVGWIYIYLLPGEFNMVKIGITQIAIQRRLDAWTEKCSHKLHLAYPRTESERQLIPHVYRVEALVQAELAASRLEELQCSCGDKHKEWFEEELAHARKVVIKWSDWMSKHPYQESEPIKWGLSKQHEDDLVRLSCPSLRYEIIVPARASGSKGPGSPNPRGLARRPKPSRPMTAPL